METRDEFEDRIKEVISSLEHVAKAAVKQKFQPAVEDSLFSLEEIGNEAVTMGFESTIKSVIFSLGEICKTAVMEEFDFAVENSALSLEKVGIKVLDQRIIYDSSTYTDEKNKVTRLINYIADSFDKICKASIQQSSETTFNIEAESLKNIALYAIQKEKHWSVKKLLVTLENLGKEIVRNRFEGNLDIVVSSFEEVGIEVVKWELDNRYPFADMFLESVTKTLEKLAKETIALEMETETKNILNALRSLSLPLFQPINWDKSNSWESEKIIELFQNDVSILSSSIGTISIMCSQQNFVGPIRLTISLLGSIGTRTLNQESMIEISENEIIDSVNFIVSELEVIGRIAAEENLEAEIIHLSSTFEKIAKEATNKGMVEVVTKIITYLGEIGVKISKKGEIIDISGNIIKSLGNIGNNSLNKNMEDLVICAVRDIRKVEKYLYDQNIDEEVSKVIALLEEIGKNSAKKEWQEATLSTIDMFREIGLTSFKEGTTAQNALISLYMISEITIDKELIIVTRQIVLAIYIIGIKAVDENRVEIAREAEWDLNNIYRMVIGKYPEVTSNIEIGLRTQVYKCYNELSNKIQDTFN